MSKDTYTGLYSDEAYETLLFVSAIDAFVNGAGEAEDYEDEEEAARFDLHGCFEHNTSSIGGFGDLSVWGFSVDWLENKQFWNNVAEITRSAVDGEIIIKDYFNDENRLINNKATTVFTHSQLSWPYHDNADKMCKLAFFINSTVTFLKQAFGNDDYKELDTVGHSWMEPENYHGRWSVYWSTLRTYPNRTRHFRVRLSSLMKLFEYFNTGGLSEVSTELKGIPWDPFKAKSYVEMRVLQHEKLVAMTEEVRRLSPKKTPYDWVNTSNIADQMTDSFYKVERYQRFLEDEWRKSVEQ